MLAIWAGDLWMNVEDDDATMTGDVTGAGRMESQTISMGTMRGSLSVVASASCIHIKLISVQSSLNTMHTRTMYLTIHSCAGTLHLKTLLLTC